AHWRPDSEGRRSTETAVRPERLPCRFCERKLELLYLSERSTGCMRVQQVATPGFTLPLNSHAPPLKGTPDNSKGGYEACAIIRFKEFGIALLSKARAWSFTDFRQDPRALRVRWIYNKQKSRRAG